MGCTFVLKIFVGLLKNYSMNKLKIAVVLLSVLLVLQTLIFISFTLYNNDRNFRNFIDNTLMNSFKVDKLETNQSVTLNDIVSYRIYGDVKDDVVYSVKFLSNYTLLFGSKEGKHDLDLWLIEIDDTGSVVREITFDQGGNEVGINLDSVDNEIYLSSEVSWKQGRGDVWFLKLTNFHVEWDFAIAGNDNESYPVIKFLSDGTLVGAFSSKTPHSNSVSLCLFHIRGSDFSNIICFESPISQVPISIVEVSNSYWVIGETKSFSFGESDIFVASFSKEDELKWFKIYGTKFFESPTGVIATGDGVLISVSSKLFSLIKLDFDGNIVWVENYKKGSVSQFFVDGENLFAAGTMYDPYSSKNMFIFKRGEDVFWEDFFSFSYNEVPIGMFVKSNTIYLIGNSYNDATKKDVWFVRLRTLTNLYVSNSVSNLLSIDTNMVMVKEISPGVTKFLVSSTNSEIFNVFSKYSLPKGIKSRFESEIRFKKSLERSKKSIKEKKSVNKLKKVK